MPEWLNTGNVKWRLDTNGNIITDADEGESGLTGGGYWYRFASGLQICAAHVALPFFDADMFRAIWTYPQPFLTGVILTCSVRNVSSGAIIQNLGTTRAITVDGATGDLRVYRVTGAPNFTVSDSVSVFAHAIGLWK
jgi:hypothetical protein